MKRQFAQNSNICGRKTNFFLRFAQSSCRNIRVTVILLTTGKCHLARMVFER